MSHRLPIQFHQRGITIDLGPITATIGDGSDDSSTATPTPTAPPPDASTSSESNSSKSIKSTKSTNSTKSTKTSKEATTSETSTSSSSSRNLTSPSTTSSSSSISSSLSTASVTSTLPASTTSQTAAAASTTAASSSHSGGTSPGLVAFAVIICIAFVGAITWVVIMRRHAKQREWTFQQHQRIFERFDKSKGNDSDNDILPNTPHTAKSSIYPPMPVVAADDGKAWSAGTGASVITTGPSVVRNLDWDQGPERRPKSVIEAKPKRKPVPPPKEIKKKTFSQYLPYLLPQNHSAETIELGKAQQQAYQRPIYKPAG